MGLFASTLKQEIEKINQGEAEIYIHEGTHRNVGDDDIVTICDAIKVNYKTVKSLDLSTNTIGPVGASHLSSLLKDPSSKISYLENKDSKYFHLKTYSLSSNAIGDAGAISISEVLASDTALVHLYLSNNGLSDEGVAKLSAALAGNTTLKSLWLLNNKKITSDAVASLKDILEFSGVASINVEGTSISAEDQSFLEKLAETPTSHRKIPARKPIEREASITIEPQSASGQIQDTVSP